MKTVLLIDGDHDSRIVYRTILRHYGYTVAEAEDGELGLRLARELRPEVVVTELTVPKLGGLELITALRADPATEHLCVLVLTAISLATERERAETAGCNKFMTKPIEPTALLQEIESVTKS